MIINDAAPSVRNQDTGVVAEIHAVIEQILRTRGDVLLLACQQRAKFEGWLKFELAASLCQRTGFEKIAVESGYATGGRSDISFESQGSRWHIEMKTANTNWRADGLENRGRPVTRNMDGIAEDILVLRQKASPDKGIAAFCIFPVPKQIWKMGREQLNYHLRHIEKAANLSGDLLVNQARFTEIGAHFGMCTFVLEIDAF